MSRRTHYIPVGNLVLDGVSIDPEIYCPANGYPDPTAPETLAQYCPAGGYYDPAAPLDYIPDPNMPPTPEPGSGEITLICTTALDAAVNLRTTTSAGQATYKIYGADDNLIYQQNVNSNTLFFYEFPSTGGISLTSGLQGFKVIITPVSGNITQFSVPAKSGFAPLGWPILEAHIKCPDLTSMLSAFLNQKYLQLIKFYEACDSLLNCESIAEGTANLKKCIMPTSLNALTNLTEAFWNSGVEEVVLPASLPALLTLYRAFQNSRIKKNPFENTALPIATDLRLTLAYCSELRGTVTLPELPSATNISWIIENSKLVRKVVFQGKMNGAIGSNASYIVRGCESLEEIILPVEMTGALHFQYLLQEAYALKKVVFPQSLTLNIVELSITNLWLSLCPALEEIVWPTSFTNLTNPYRITYGGSNLRKITQFVVPAFAPYRANILGSSSFRSPLTYINIDFSQLTEDFNISYNQLSNSELERIAGLLPTIPAMSAKFICGWNAEWTSGAPTWNYLIAEAKGWDVWVNANSKGF